MANGRKNQRGFQEAVGKVQKNISKLKYKCIYPGCFLNSIDSHSQQKEKQLRSISVDGLVYGFDRNMYQALKKSDEQVIQMRKIGIGKASSFLGYCADHDKNLFRDIEQSELVENNHKQAALLFIRAISYEYTQKRKVFDFFRLLLEETESKLVVDQIRMFETMKAGTNKFLTQDFPAYYSTLFEAIENNDYSKINTSWKTHNSNIGLSSCCVFSPILNLDNRHFDRSRSGVQSLVSFNLIPASGQTHIVTSWLSQHDNTSKWIKDFIQNEANLEQFINLAAFCESEDTCINPEIWENIEPEKQKLAAEVMRHDIFRGPISEVPIIVNI